MRYESGEEVEADMKLVFDNAIKYNPPGHPIHMQVSLFPRARRREWAMKRSGGEHGGWVWHTPCTCALDTLPCTCAPT
jgi:hypothetical protein